MKTRLCFAALCLAALPAVASDAMAPYPVSVWTRVLFGVDGKPAEYAVVDEEKYPAKFVENVKVRVAQAKIQPPLVEGKPATLRSGVEMRFTVTPNAEGGGAVRVDGLSVGPIPIQKSLAAYPADIAANGGWEGQVLGICTVGVQGRCKTVEVVAQPGMPESVRRYAKASLDGWVFEPQLVDGKPVESEYRLLMYLNTLDTTPEDFRQDKFERLLKKK